MSTNWTPAKIGDQRGRVAVITGANTGLGLETARELARAGAQVILAVRDEARGEAAAKDITSEIGHALVTVEQLDLGSLASILSAADRITAAHERIDLLINNAGVMYVEHGLTENGYETHMGVNHLGHFALTGLLLPKMIDVADSRVVTVSSMGHRVPTSFDFDDPGGADKYNRVLAYSRSKLANLLFTYELQRRLSAAKASTIAVAAHPGASDTELARNSPAIVQRLAKVAEPVLQSAAEGAWPTLLAAVDSEARGGDYYGPGGKGEIRGHPKKVSSSKRSHDRNLQEELWKFSEEATYVEFTV